MSKLQLNEAITAYSIHFRSISRCVHLPRPALNNFLHRYIEASTDDVRNFRIKTKTSSRSVGGRSGSSPIMLEASFSLSVGDGPRGEPYGTVTGRQYE